MSMKCNNAKINVNDCEQLTSTCLIYKGQHVFITLNHDYYPNLFFMNTNFKNDFLFNKN